MVDLNNKRIFIIEDNPTNLAVYAVTLKRFGALIIQDYWSVNTIEMMKRSLPLDLVLLDLMLRGGVSGYDIFDKIKDAPELVDIAVLAVSASDPEVEVPKTKEKGFNGFISKPINVQAFPEQVAKCMNGGEVWYDD